MAELENHMVIGDDGNEAPEPRETELECYSCGYIKEGVEYKVYSDKWNDKTICICEECQDMAKWNTAEIEESDDDDEEEMDEDWQTKDDNVWTQIEESDYVAEHHARKD